MTTGLGPVRATRKKILLNLLSCLPFGLQAGFSSFSTLAEPSLVSRARRRAKPWANCSITQKYQLWSCSKISAKSNLALLSSRHLVLSTALATETITNALGFFLETSDLYGLKSKFPNRFNVRKRQKNLSCKLKTYKFRIKTITKRAR